jgi:hypothetical protein
MAFFLPIFEAPSGSSSMPAEVTGLPPLGLHPSSPLRGRCIGQETEWGNRPVNVGAAGTIRRRPIPPSVRLRGHLPRKRGEESEGQAAGVCPVALPTERDSGEAL